jgi:hypothetical protein
MSYLRLAPNYGTTDEVTMSQAATNTKVSLFDVITIDGRQYITSQKLHADKKASGMKVHAELKHFNEAIKSLTTYSEMLALGHVIYAEYSQVDDIAGGRQIRPLIISNSYKPILLLDATAQQTIEQHLNDEASKISSLGANSLSAAVKTGDAASMNTAQQALGAQGVQNPLMAIAGFMTSEGLELLLITVREKEAAQREAKLAQEKLAIESAEKEKALAQAAYQDKALTVSQINNGKLTKTIHKLEKENHKLNLAVCGQLEYMSIKQFIAAVGIKGSKNTNQLVVELTKLSEAAELEVKKIIIGEEKWPSKAFQAAFLNENIDLIKKYFA